MMNQRGVKNWLGDPLSSPYRTSAEIERHHVEMVRCLYNKGLFLAAIRPSNGDANDMCGTTDSFTQHHTDVFLRRRELTSEDGSLATKG